MIDEPLSVPPPPLFRFAPAFLIDGEIVCRDWRTAGMVGGIPANPGPNHAERRHLVSCRRSAAGRACFQGSLILNFSIARFVARCLEGQS
jgi:hypothetical protein